MARVAISARLLGHSGLVLGRGVGDHFQLETVTGDGCVMVVERRTARRLFTYDTGQIETVFVHLDPAAFDLSRDEVVIDRWRAIGLQFGVPRLLYVSQTASGTITLRRHRDKRFGTRLLGRSRVVFDGMASLRFSAPLLDTLKDGEVAVEWSFTLAEP